ncbi:excalibur calcium-binding domain-containing protein [Streptomyces meridianus]|uniref:Excalibur calcium-binding domain-containing protein n=1 Tax=Streptomyces meridianus TaxID=2938945 RepID=A0ABT0X153_9ACTN|nr:excalibur calcium-binding domain-containing protein [Streptomyces meridianus]MCM2576248.1 excalibur calcium-binding domain-containing protein [Streptomyces meridianus]
MTRRTMRLSAGPSLALALVLSPALASCTSTTSPTGGETVTRTVPGDSGSSGPAGTSPRADSSGRPSGKPRATSPAEVVTAYYAAINARDFRTAWELGGRNLASSYDAFAAGFDGLERDDLTILGTSGSRVEIALDAVQTDGTTKSFRGTYTVRHGEIVAASVREVAEPGPREGSSEPAGHYENCTEAHRDGVFDIPGDAPAYRRELDRDQDGLACEPHESKAPAPTSSSPAAPPS